MRQSGLQRISYLRPHLFPPLLLQYKAQHLLSGIQLVEIEPQTFMLLLSQPIEVQQHHYGLPIQLNQSFKFNLYNSIKAFLRTYRNPTSIFML